MKTTALTGKRKSQVFVTAIIVLAIVLTLGGALLFHSRSLRDATRLQVYTEKAYSLAKSGIDIGRAMIENPGPCGRPPFPIHKQYSVSSGTINIDLVPDQGKLTSTGDTGKSLRVIEKTFEPYTEEINLPQWAKVYEIDATYFSSGFTDSKPTPDGGYVILGVVQESILGNGDFFLIKTDSKGNIEWTRRGGSSALSESPECVLPVSDGYVIGGTVGDGATNNLFLIKTNSQGYVGAAYPGTWERTYGESLKSETALSLQQVSSGYLIIGSAQPSVAGLTDCLGIKTDLDGHKVWGYRYSNSFQDYCSCGQEIGGYYVLAGQALSSYDCFFIKLRSDGVYDNLSKKWGSAFVDTVSAFLTFQEGSQAKYVFGGMIRPPPTYSNSLYLLKTNTDGTRVWSKTYVYSISDGFSTFQRTADGGYILGGTTSANLLRGADFVLIKTDDQGNVIWDKAYGGGGGEGEMHFIKEVVDGYVFGGITGSWGGLLTNDFILVKTDTEGNINCCSDFTVDLSVSAGSNTFDTSTMTWSNPTTGNYTDSTPAQVFNSGNYTPNSNFVCPQY